MHSFIKLAKFVIVAGLGVGFLIPVAVHAENSTISGTPKQNMRETVKQKVEEKIQNINRNAVIISGKLTAKNGNSLTISKESKTYTILVDSKTQLLRRFWGKATLDEIQVNDTLNVYGKWTDDAKTTIQARMIRDASIQKRFGVFIGTVKSTSSTGWVITTHRGDQTVTVDTQTKIVNRKEQTIAQSDIVVGHRVRVRGLWDMVNKTITEVTQVKDFTLPVQPKTTVTPTTTLAPTPTP
jgi:hypothetical protein